MANVIRQDVVEVSFKIDDTPLSKLNKEMDGLASNAEGNLGKDTFKGLANSAKTASSDVKGLANNTKTAGGKVKELAKTSMEKLKSGLASVKTKLTEIAKKAGTAAYNGLKKIAGISFKALAAGIGAAAVGVGTLVAKSVSAFADYEQLVGGVDTLFKGSSKTVQQYADNAYKTAGLSANQYMETVTSFSAAMINSVGGDTAKAAKLSDMALTDMSDNANKMGTSMETVIGTYQSLSRGNYAMLDNLKLGYGGTKEELERLIKTAASTDLGKEMGVKEGVTDFANIAKAIHVVQSEMDITGTTAKEASGTISGSFAAVKATWANLMPALIKGGDSFDQCVDNLVSSVETFGKNIMPAIEKALSGVGTLIEKLAPTLAEKLPSIISTLLPPLIKAAGSLIGSLVANLPSIVSSLIPAIKEAGTQIVKALYEGFTGKEMSKDTFSGIEKAIDGVLKVAKVAVPVIGGLVLAFKGFNKIKAGAAAVKKVAGGIGSIASKVTGGLAPKISGVGDSIQKTGTKSKISSKNMLATAKSFMMLGAGVLMVAAGFGILAFSAIALANAGGLAIGVMFGLVVALAGLGFGMAVLLKSISSIGSKAMPAATAMLMLGGAVILIAAGFALLAYTAISLANAGGAAIAVFAGMVVAMALLAVGAAALGTALTAGAVGFIAFGAAVLMVGAGFALIGVSAMLAATALSIVAGILPQITTYGLSGALAITALGGSLIVFALGAALAGVAAIVLGAGLLVATVGIAAMALSTMLLVASFAMLTALMLPLVATSMLLGTSFLLVSTTMMLLSAMSLLMATSMLLLSTAMLMVTPMTLLFTAALLPLSAAMLVLSPTVLIFTAAMTALSAIFMLLAPMALMFSAAIVLLKPAFSSLSKSVPKFAKALSPLAGQFTKLIIPIGLLVAALLPLSAEFAALAVAATALLASVAGLTTTTMMLSMLFMRISAMTTIMVTTFNVLGTAAVALAAKMPALATALMAMVAPLTVMTPQFVRFASSAMTATTATVAMTAALMQLSAATTMTASSYVNMESVIRSSSQRILTTIKGMLKQIVSAIKSTNLTSVGTQMMNGLIIGINSKKAAAVAAARSIATAMNKEFDKIQDIHSPSGVWEQKGIYMPQGLINGVEKMIPAVRKTTQKAAEVAIPYSNGYSAERSTSYTSNRSSNAEYNSYAPVFNFNISGNGDTRATARAVKKAAKEAVHEMFESMNRRTPQLVEI